jgi:hypothetical protein
MIVCQRTVLVGGFVLAALEAVIRSMLMRQKLNTVMRTWLFFTALAVTIAYTARIGITANSLLSISL